MKCASLDYRPQSASRAHSYTRTLPRMVFLPVSKHVELYDLLSGSFDVCARGNVCVNI